MNNKENDLNISLRKATKNDAMPIFLIEQENIGQESVELIKSALENPNYLFLVAEMPEESKNRVVGFIEILLLADDCEIISIAVDKSYLRQKIGSNLLIAAVNHAKSLGKKNMFLEVRCSNDAAIKFYSKFNFLTIGTRKAYYKTKGALAEDALVMQKILY